MMGYGGWGWGLAGGIGWLWMLFPMLFWVGVVFLVIWAAIRLFPGRQESVHDTPLDILKRRYAAGEITAAEYQQAKQDLAK
jgi:putative membrane protein